MKIHDQFGNEAGRLIAMEKLFFFRCRFCRKKDQGFVHPAGINMDKNTQRGRLRLRNKMIDQLRNIIFVKINGNVFKTVTIEIKFFWEGYEEMVGTLMNVLITKIPFSMMKCLQAAAHNFSERKYQKKIDKQSRWNNYYLYGSHRELTRIYFLNSINAPASISLIAISQFSLRIVLCSGVSPVYQFDLIQGESISNQWGDDIIFIVSCCKKQDVTSIGLLGSFSHLFECVPEQFPSYPGWQHKQLRHFPEL